MKPSFTADFIRCPEKLLTALLSGYAIFLGFITLQAIGFSAVHFSLNRATALAILAISLLAGIASTIGILRISASAEPHSRETPRRLRNLFCLGGGICIAVYLSFWMTAYFTPDRSFDGDFYHLPAMSAWAQEGRIHWVAPEMEANSLKYINGYAKGGEVIGYVTALACGETFATAINCMFLPLGILGIALLALRWGASPTAAVFAGLLFLLVPVNVWQAPTTYIDTAFAACVIAFFAFFYRYLELASIENKSAESWLMSLLSGTTLGLALGVKGNGVWMTGMVFALLAALGLYFIYRFWSMESQQISIKIAGGKLPPETVSTALKLSGPTKERENKKEFRQFILRWYLQAVAMLTVCLLIGGFWYARNYLRTGNPLYPIAVKIAGREVFPGVDPFQFLQENMPEEWSGKSAAAKVALAWSESWDWQNASLCDARRGGLGIFWMLCCLPAILLVSLNRLNTTSPAQAACSPSKEISREKISWQYWILLGMAIVFFLFTPANWWARYTVWIYGIGLPCFAVVLTWLIKAADKQASGVSESKHFSAQFAFSHRDHCTNMRLRVHWPWPWRKIGVLWLSAGLLLLFAEGFYSLREMFRWQAVVSKTSNAQGNDLCSIFYPDLAKTEIPQIIQEGHSIALGVLDLSKPYPGRNPGFLMLGVLSQPLNTHPWGLIDRRMNEISLKKLQSGEFEYLIWDRTIPLPKPYARLVRLEKSYPGFFDLYRITAPVSARDEKVVKR